MLLWRRECFERFVQGNLKSEAGKAMSDFREYSKSGKLMMLPMDGLRCEWTIAYARTVLSAEGVSLGL